MGVWAAFFVWLVIGGAGLFALSVIGYTLHQYRDRIAQVARWREHDRRVGLAPRARALRS